MLVNRPEFNLLDTALLHLGATPFSIYNTSSPEQIEYLFSNAENRLVADRAPVPADIRPTRRGVAGLDVVVIDADATDSWPTWRRRRADFDFEAAWRAVRPAGRRHADLHLGHDRPAQGRAAPHRN